MQHARQDLLVPFIDAVSVGERREHEVTIADGTVPSRVAQERLSELLTL